MLAHNALANGASSSCERVGSLLHEMHQDQLTSPRTVRRLRLREAKVQCIGSARDEELLAALVDLFVQSGKNPILQKRQRWVRRRSDIPEEGPIPNSSPKDVVGARAEALALSAQNDLASLAVKESLAATFIGAGLSYEETQKYATRVPVAQYLQGATLVDRKTGKLQIQELQPFIKSGRAAKKQCPRSTMRQQLAEWLESEEGQSWQAAKDALWKGFGEDTEAQNV